MSYLTIFLVILVTTLNGINSEGFYSIVAPGTLRPNSEYHVGISIHNTKDPTTVEVGINGPTLSLSQIVELKPISMEVLKFDIPDIKYGDYNLTAKGLSRFTFSNTTKLNFESNKYVVMIQTDKATYKPGDLVRYRVIVLDRYLKPTEIGGPVNITIQDKNQNIIKQNKDVKLTSGVYTGEMQLSNFSVLGNWQIDADVDGDLESKTFEVAEYVLPKFETTIESANDVLLEDGKIHITVRSKYTYGKPVKGEAVITIDDFKTTTPIDGKAHVVIDINNDLKALDVKSERLIKITANVEEKLTGLKHSATKDINIHIKKYNIKSVKIPSGYKPNEPFEIIVKVTKYDGTPVQDTTNPIVINLVNNRDEHDKVTFETTLDKAGIATINAKLSEPQKSYNIRAKYLEDDVYVGYLYQTSPSTPRNDFHILQKTENPKVDEEVVFEVNSPENMKYFIYQIVAHGDILETKLVEVPDKKSHDLKIQPTYLMSPTANLFVYTVKDGELIFDETTINFPEKLGNFVDIDIPEQAKPGEEIDIKIKANPNSYVGLLGVDQSVLLLKSGNDLTKDLALNKAKQFKTSTPSNRGHGTYPGQTSGVVTLTNAHYPWDDYRFVFRRGDRRKLRTGGHRKTASSKSIQQIKPRKQFPETWIWESTNNENGTALIHKKVPDTITSWVLTGFSIDPINGFGLTENAEKLRVFQPFFVSTNLPYSVKRGEVIAIPIAVFNYLEKNLDAEIILDNEDQEFEFTELTNDVVVDPKDQLKRSKRVAVSSNSGEAVSFMIRPKKVGNIKLKITAITPIAGDAVEQMLLVEPEGVTEYVNKAVFIDLRKNTEQKETFQVAIPENVVPDSTHIEVSVVGDILGPTIKNLDKLVRMPYGCGEQNMVNFVPNILVLKYLEAIGQLTSDIESKAKNFLEIGYQRELTYKHDDGSYSAFGKSDSGGSTWLTAYVARSFRQAAEYTQIDEKVITAALDFLASKQADDGSFPEVGRLVDKNYGGTEGVALTAFVVLSFLENSEKIPNYKTQVHKALDYIAKKTESSNDLYTLALSAYALQIAKHNARDVVMNKVEGRATKEGDKKYWSNTIEGSEKVLDSHDSPRNINVEITSYILLALLEADQTADSLPIVKWLISKRNSNGGFDSTQDTVVGLQALSKFAQSLSPKGTNIEMITKVDEDVKAKLQINSDNAIVLQTYELPSDLSEVTLSASGQGVALAQISYRYNLNNTQPKSSFAIIPKMDSASNSDYLKFMVCISFVPGEGATEKESNMALAEINLPSGFTIDNEAVKALQNMDAVKKVETKKGDSVVVLYFDSLGIKEVCPIIESYKTHKVADLKPAAIIVYDYYDNTRKARIFYDGPQSALCDICEGDDCGTKCPKKE